MVEAQIDDGQLWGDPLASIVAVMAFHEKPCDRAQLLHAIGSAAPRPIDATRFIQRSGLRAKLLPEKILRGEPSLLERLPMPVLAVGKSGGLCLVVRASGREVICQVGGDAGKVSVSRSSFDETWPGGVIPVARRATLRIAVDQKDLVIEGNRESIRTGVTGRAIRMSVATGATHLFLAGRKRE
jgi:ABC-type bacteriocin/lantibiotic exporter with double-glycine peptidase domain